MKTVEPSPSPTLGEVDSRLAPALLRRRKLGPGRRQFDWMLLWLALPAFIVYSAFLVGPTLASFAYSFTRWDGINDPVFIGFDNYARLFQDEKFANALINTGSFAVTILVGQIVFGLGLALMLNRNSRASTGMRAVFFTPALLSTAVIALIWGFIFNPLVGLFSALVEGGPLEDSQLADVLGGPDSAFLGLSFVVIWQYAGYIMVIYLAGLKSISAEMYEAAALDGATGWIRFRTITWPLLAPSTSIAVILSIAGNLRLFDQVFLTTGGGPDGATETMAILIYRTAFSNSDFGYSVTQSVMMTLFTLLLLVGRHLFARRGRTS